VRVCWCECVFPSAWVSVEVGRRVVAESGSQVLIVCSVERACVCRVFARAERDVPDGASNDDVTST